MQAHNVRNWSKQDIVHRLAQLQNARSAKPSLPRETLESELEGELARRVGFREADRLVQEEANILHAELNAMVVESWKSEAA